MTNRNIALILVVILIGGLVFYYTEEFPQETALPRQTPAKEETVGGQRDEHGCLTAAGYNWCEPKQKCLREWEEPCGEPDTEQLSDVALITQALLDKHSWAREEVIVTVTKNTGTHATGSVRFTAEGPGGGMFLAAKSGDNWNIAWDGNGTISCQSIEPYNFPVDMVPECWDEDNQQLIERIP